MYRSKSEKLFAEALNSQGFEFEVNASDLPGTPDILFRESKLAIFFNGCFWHSHHCKPAPKSYLWKQNLREIRESDQRNLFQLKNSGFYSLVIWECDWAERRKQMLQLINSYLSLAQSRA